MSNSKFQNIMNYFDNDEEEEEEENYKGGKRKINERYSDTYSEKRSDFEKEEIDEEEESENKNEENEDYLNNNEKESSENNSNEEDIYSNEENYKPIKPTTGDSNNLKLKPQSTKVSMDDYIYKHSSNDLNFNNFEDDSFLIEQEKRRQERLKKEKEEDEKNKLNKKKDETKEGLGKKEEENKETIRKENESFNNNLESNNIIYDEKKDEESENLNSSYSSNNKSDLKKKEEKIKLMLQQKKEENERLKKKKEEAEKTKNLNYSENNFSEKNLSERNLLNEFENSINPFEIDSQTKILNSQFSENNSLKREINQINISFQDNKNKNQKNSSFENKKKNKISTETIKSFFKPILYNNNNNEYTFKPKINNNSKKILENKINKSNTYKEKNKSIDNILKKEGKKKRNEKNDLEKESYLNANKSKISNNSHNLAIKSLEKKIENCVKKYEINGEINFIGVCKVLYELRIFKEILKENNKNENYNNLSDNELLEIIKNKYKNRKRDDEYNSNGITIEIDFLEQIWFKLNTNNKEYINSDNLSKFLVIIFSPVQTTTKEIVEILEKYLQIALFMDSKNYIRLSNESNNDINDNNIISKIKGEYVSNEEKWSLEKIVNCFFTLKKNRIAYIYTGNISKIAERELKKEKEKCPFHPNLNNSNTYNNPISNKDFIKKINKYNDDEKIKQLTLNKIRKKYEEEQFAECTFKPDISLSKINNLNISYNTNVYEKLFSEAQQNQNNKKMNIEQAENEKEKKLNDICTFFPKINHNLNKSFDNIKKSKHYNNFIKRTRGAILQRAYTKYLQEKIPVGENYLIEKERRIKQFKSSFDNKKKKEKIKALESDSEGEMSDGETPYLLLCLNNGNKTQNIRIYVNDDPRQIARNIGIRNGISRNIIDKFVEVIRNFQNQYLKEKNKNKIK